MLERGHTVFDCQIVRLLLENDVYQSYLVDCSDSTTAKLFLLLPNPLFDQQQRQSFFDHADWLSFQTFPHVGSPIKAEEIDGKAACLYPFASGTPLVKSLDEGCSVRQALKLIKNIAECLSAPHAANLCHGSLSPETIYLEGDTPYLADFSLCQLIQMDYNSGINPQFTSPEQVRGETPGTASDIYSLGCILYHLLVGQPPFSGADAFAIAKQHLQGEFPYLPEELSLFQPLIESLVKLTVEERPAIDDFINQVTQLAGHQKIDQLYLSIADDNAQSEEVADKDEVSLLDEAIDNSEIAARIDARLSAHAVDLQKSELDEMQKEKQCDPTDALDQIVREEQPGFWRFVLVLLLGVMIGSGLYFLFYKQSPAIPPVVVEPVVDPDRGLVADLDQGLQLWQNADFNSAEAQFKKVISVYSDDPRAYNNLAAFYAAQGNYDQARNYLEQALATDENYATIYRNLGAVYAEMARGSYGRALQLDKGQARISLPVFSSQGIINPQPVVADNTVTQQPSLKEEPTSPVLAEVGQQIPAAAIAAPVVSGESQPIVVDQQSPLPIILAKWSDPDIDINGGELPSTAKDEFLNESELGDSAPLVVKQENAEMFLQRWADAWSRQDVGSYLSFYAEKFTPPAGRKRVAWEAQRRSRIASPEEIVVSLDDFQIAQQENGNLEIEVIQSYKSDILADRTRKIFNLQPSETSWKILRERSLGVSR